VGALLGSMCGNALGAQVEPEKHYRLARLFPEGLQASTAAGAAAATRMLIHCERVRKHGLRRSVGWLVCMQARAAMLSVCTLG
jgi:hypothetical protein